MHFRGMASPGRLALRLLRAVLGRVSLFLCFSMRTATQDVHVLRGLARRPASLLIRTCRNFGGPRGALQPAALRLEWTSLGASTLQALLGSR